jgi:hypothetical protein
MRRFQWRKSSKSIQNAILLVFAVALFSFKSSSQSSNSSLYVSPEVFFENTQRADGLQSHLGYGLSITVPTSDGIMVGIRAVFANPASEFDLVGANGIEQTRLSVYQALCAFRLFQLANVVDLSVLGRLGFMTISTKERLVSAGGFGSIKVPARSNQFATYSFGLNASKELGPHLSAFLSPQLVFLSPVRMSSIGYSIGGGLSVGIF